MADDFKAMYPVLAALAHPVCREVFAQVELGTFQMSEEDNPNVAKALSQLQRAKLIVLDKSGFSVNAGIFKELLNQDEAKKADGNETVVKFMREGRISQFPAKQNDREKLMRLVAAAVFSSGQHLTETQVDERLSRYHEDTAFMRRFMVDNMIVGRANDGSEYWLIEDNK
ncbi:DUF2087 domain-containing protein [Micrococcoides hystricis]|uniref:DUF2087 domain-containing protein n=1 Tax=Micrococcoides hystricis TaxID=1572761 RepID=A0ABV6PCB1_9MICC